LTTVNARHLAGKVDDLANAAPAVVGPKPPAGHELDRVEIGKIRPTRVKLDPVASYVPTPATMLARYKPG